MKCSHPHSSTSKIYWFSLRLFHSLVSRMTISRKFDWVVVVVTNFTIHEKWNKIFKKNAVLHFFDKCGTNIATKDMCQSVEFLFLAARKYFHSSLLISILERSICKPVGRTIFHWLFKVSFVMIEKDLIRDV